jgi:hypothetical protein
MIFFSASAPKLPALTRRVELEEHELALGELGVKVLLREDEDVVLAGAGDLVVIIIVLVVVGGVRARKGGKAQRRGKVEREPLGEFHLQGYEGSASIISSQCGHNNKEPKGKEERARSTRTRKS